MERNKIKNAEYYLGRILFPIDSEMEKRTLKEIEDTLLLFENVFNVRLELHGKGSIIEMRIYR